MTGQRSNQLSYAPAIAREPRRARAPAPVCQGSAAPAAGPVSARPRRELASRPVVATRLAPWRSSALLRCSTANPLPVLLDDLRDERAARVPFPPGETRFSLPRTRRFAEEPLPSAARGLRALRPGLHAAAVPRQRRVHARARGQPLHHRLPRLQLHLARRALPRPDRPDGRRAADDRRRLPPPLAPDHAARLPPRAHRRLGRRDRARRPTARSTQLDARRDDRPVRVDAPPRAARGDARAVRPRPRRRARRARSTPPACSSRRSPSTRPTTCCACSAARATPVGAHAAGGAQARHADLRRDLRAARERASAAATSSACCSTRRTRTATALSDLQIRDEVMTLLFAGHDTTTSTVSFMFYELARQPADRRAPARRAGRAARAAARPTRRAAASAASCPSSRWCSTRRCASTRRPGSARGARSSRSSSKATRSPARAFVNYCSWASHHLPDVFPDPEEFRPERFTPEARAALPKGAYVPFGGGSRTCIGMRFGQLEVRTIATLHPRRASRSRCPTDFELTIRQMPTISPKEGLPMRVARAPGAPRAPLRRPPPERLSAARALIAQPVARRLAAGVGAARRRLARTRAGRRTASAEAFEQQPCGMHDELAVARPRATASTDAPTPNSPPLARTCDLPAFAAEQLHADARPAARPRTSAALRCAPRRVSALPRLRQLTSLSAQRTLLHAAARHVDARRRRALPTAARRSAPGSSVRLPARRRRPSRRRPTAASPPATRSTLHALARVP